MYVLSPLFNIWQYAFSINVIHKKEINRVLAYIIPTVLVTDFTSTNENMVTLYKPVTCIKKCGNVVCQMKQIFTTHY